MGVGGELTRNSELLSVCLSRRSVSGGEVISDQMNYGLICVFKSEMFVAAFRLKTPTKKQLDH